MYCKNSNSTSQTLINQLIMWWFLQSHGFAYVSALTKYLMQWRLRKRIFNKNRWPSQPFLLIGWWVASITICVQSCLNFVWSLPLKWCVQYYSLSFSTSHCCCGYVVLCRASEAVKQMELSQQHEVEETAALEKMMQKVEANLETTTVQLVCCSRL